MKKLLTLLLTALAAISCLSDPEPGEFCPPEIVAVRSAVERNVVVLNCEVEGKSGVKECGFLFGTTFITFWRFHEEPNSPIKYLGHLYEA